MVPDYAEIRQSLGQPMQDFSSLGSRCGRRGTTNYFLGLLMAWSVIRGGVKTPIKPDYDQLIADYYLQNRQIAHLLARCRAFFGHNLEQRTSVVARNDCLHPDS